MDLLTRRKTAEKIIGHECRNTEVGVGRDAQVEVIPYQKMYFRQKIVYLTFKNRTKLRYSKFPALEIHKKSIFSTKDSVFDF